MSPFITNIKTTVGGISFSGSVATGRMQDILTFHVFGDPSLQIRTSGELPTGYLKVEYERVLPVGTTELEIRVTNQSGIPVQGALCALSNNGNLLGRNYTDINGEAVIVFEPQLYPQISSGPVAEFDLVITAFNRETLIDTLSVPSPPLSERGEMLVITHDFFYNQMNLFVEWKNQKGIPTEMITRTEIINRYGNFTNETIRTCINDTFHQLKLQGRTLAYVLLVGDDCLIPTNIVKTGIPMSSEWGASDQIYSYLVGDDYYPDLIIGRFPARSIAHIKTIVKRTIAYEKNPLGGNWYRKGICAAGSPFNGWNFPSEMDEIWQKLVDYSPTYDAEDVDRLYAVDGGGYSTPQDLLDALNDGRSILNYYGHGGPDYWCFNTTQGPTDDFTVDHIHQLENTFKLPYIWQVACETGNFTQQECFAEAWLHATDSNGDPTGAIAVCMPSVSVASGQIAHHEMVDIITDNSYHKKTTFGGIVYNALSYMIYYNDDYRASRVYHIFGDPSVQLRTNNPQTIYVEYDPDISFGTTEIPIRVTRFMGVEVPDALCAISYKDQLSHSIGDNIYLLGHAYTNKTGEATIVIDLSRINSEIGVGSLLELDLVVSGYNTLPYFGEISVLNQLQVDPNSLIHRIHP
jgi:gingipain R